MRILAPSKSQITSLFPAIPLTDIHDIELSDAFSSFEWNDTTSQPREFVVLDQSLPHYSLGIIEDFSASSQFDRLREWQGPAIWTIAFDGNGFHGQYARSWKTIRGNLFLCLAIPVNLPIDRMNKIQLLPAEILAHALNQFIVSDVEAAIKLPNDVVIRPRFGDSSGCKIAGSLTEMRISGQRITQVRYGIGMNLITAPTVSDPGHLPACAFKDFYRSEELSDHALLPHFLNVFLNGIMRGLSKNVAI